MFGYSWKTCCANGHVRTGQQSDTPFCVGAVIVDLCSSCDTLSTATFADAPTPRFAVPVDATPDEAKALAILFSARNSQE